MVNFFKHIKTYKSEEGFTLVELMVVIVVIGILAAIAIPIFTNQQKAAAVAGLKTDVRNIVTTATTFKTKTGTYPKTCQDWRSMFPNGYSSPSTAAVGVLTSLDGMNMWIEAQGVGMGASSGANMTAQEIDSFTAIIDTSRGTGVTTRSEYMDKYGFTNRSRVFYDAGYTQSGFSLVNIGTTCQVWGLIVSP